MKKLKNLLMIGKSDMFNNKNIARLAFGFADIFILFITFQIAFNLIQTGDKTLFLTDTSYRLLFLIMLPVWIFTLQLCNIAQIPRASSKRRLLFQFMQFTLVSFVLLYIFTILFSLVIISNTFFFIFAFLGLSALYTLRIIEYQYLRWYRARGFNHLNLILIADESSISFIEDILSKKEWGYKILLIFSDSKVLSEKFGDRIKIISEKSLASLSNLLEIEIVDEVLYIKKDVITADLRASIRICEEIGVIFRLRTLETSYFLTNGKLYNIGNTVFLTFVNIPINSFSIGIKATFDIYLSFIMVLLLLPFLFIIGLSIKLTSPGPVFFKQARVGLRGREFYIYKFRTMVANAEQLRKNLEKQNEMDGPVFKIKSDPRITKIGKILRKTGLDEIPQLFNVLKGEMSLIGPRPPLQSETVQYKRWQLRRLSVKPGITCSWQIKPDRNNIKFDKWMKLDLDYIDNWSPINDLVLLVKTVGTVILGTGR